MRSLRSWFTEERAATTTDYTSALLAAQFAAARGDGGNIRAQAAYRGSLTLIGNAAGVASLSGLHSEALQGNLSTIAREMIDTGASTWVISVGSAGGVELLPCSVVDVVGSPEPSSWLYTVTLPGPNRMATVQRSGESILSFRLRVDSKTPWRGRPALDSTGTGELLCQLEAQMIDEARVSPARVVAVGGHPSLSSDVSELIGKGGVVGISQSFASREDSSPVRAGVIRNEVSAPSVSLHTTLATMICSALGVPADLVLGSSSESGSRESFRRLASTTINNIMTIVVREWTTKLGTALEFDLDRLRSSDEVSRARAVGSRSQAVSRLVDSGLPLAEAMTKVGLD